MFQEVSTLAELELLQEAFAVECKLAAGRDGQGAVPEDFWRTYSAFANSYGGVVVLGLREKNERFVVEGIANPQKVRRDLFNTLNNRQKVSLNLLTDASVREVTLEGKTVLLIEVPRAARQQRPVYLTTNPFEGNTYRRLNDGDRSLGPEEVRRMLAEQVEDSRDERLLEGYGLEHLDSETLRSYRQIFTNREPYHVWHNLGNQEFLQMIGGWRQEPHGGRAGLTLAGLLMFGQMCYIQQELPCYMLDYQEHPEPPSEVRWLDRFTLDGQWSGNLYDFFRKVYLRLTADLKVPFQLENGIRKGETPVHEAVREALANALVHADYSDRASLRIIKHPTGFSFRNPGLLRVPVEVALQGGEPDCRNRTLHKMFRLVGVGEQAGTGLPKILRGWAAQHWQPPKLHDNSIPYTQTLLELRMVDLFPGQLMARLQSHFGASFGSLSHTEQVALALAASEGSITHAQLRSLTADHPADLTRQLQRLIRFGMLVSSGGRGAVYRLLEKDQAMFSSTGSASLPTKDPSSPNLAASSTHLDPSSTHLDPSSTHLEPSFPNLLPMIIEDLAALPAQLLAQLEQAARAPRHSGKISRKMMELVILHLCTNHFVTLQCLAALVNRKPSHLRERYLGPLLREQKLELAFPTKPTHERQAYRTRPPLSPS